MSLFDELAKNGISAEDLEKAASVRLFEKAAADEGINLNELTEEQVNELFNKYITEILPAQTGQEPKQASAYAEKVASVVLFQKQAEDENIDLNQLTEDQINGLYEHFLTNVLPTLAQDQENKQANAENIKEAQAKLAEVDILGRYMARAYADELQKIARLDPEEWAAGPQAAEAPKVTPTGGFAAKATKQEAATAKKGIPKVKLEAPAAPTAEVEQAAGRLSKLLSGGGEKARAIGTAMKAHPWRTGAGAAGTAALLAGGAYGAHKLHQKRRAAAEAEKTSSLFDKIAEEKAIEILQANGIDPQTGAEAQPLFEDAVNARAIEMLQAAGYTFEG